MLLRWTEEMTRIRKPWAYKGVFVQPHNFNSSGMRWMARMSWGGTLRADSKQGMRELINDVLEANGVKRDQ